jgi:hypothetical protein
VEAPGIEPAKASSLFRTKMAESASTQLDFHFIEPGPFRPDPRLGAASGNIRAT